MPVSALQTKQKIWTDEELEALPKDGYKRELLDGEIIENPVHAYHGLVSVRMAVLLANFVQHYKLGEVFNSRTGFRLSEKILLSPDIAFVSKATLRKILVAPDKFLQGAPDLVVEVLSPSDRLVQINRKLDRYFEHGTRVAWLVNWRKQQVHVYTPDSIESFTRPNDTLTGGAVLPGFKCRLSRIFNPA
ncbi:MAG TPA: Uma2 family endonuclease [Verrucomicrobiae bacterium]|nr:Uma2 family endonuclease [Verrucomicrobiae bacterium]